MFFIFGGRGLGGVLFFFNCIFFDVTMRLATLGSCRWIGLLSPPTTARRPACSSDWVQSSMWACLCVLVAMVVVKYASSPSWARAPQASLSASKLSTRSASRSAPFPSGPWSLPWYGPVVSLTTLLRLIPILRLQLWRRLNPVRLPQMRLSQMIAQNLKVFLQPMINALTKLQMASIQSRWSLRIGNAYILFLSSFSLHFYISKNSSISII